MIFANALPARPPMLDLGPEWAAYDEAWTAAMVRHDERTLAAESTLQAAIKAAGDVYSAEITAASDELAAAVEPFRAALPEVK